MPVRVSEREWVDPHHAFWSVRDAPGVAFLESAMRGHADSAWSYLALDPAVELTLEPWMCRMRRRGQHDWSECPDWQAVVRDELARYAFRSPGAAPPFVGGWIGWLGYELAAEFDRIPVHSERLLGASPGSLAFYDAVDCYDHGQRRRWRAEIGVQESQALEELVWDSHPVASPVDPVRVMSNMTQREYDEMLRRAIEYIYAGDIYQVNLSRQIRVAGHIQPADVYVRLRQLSPAPYAAYLAGADGVLVSSSPELFFDLNGGTVISRPIKGTRPRGASHGEDVRLALELAASSKDNAENLMIVDLVRNDLGRVCRPGSVTVPEIFRRELHPTVIHLVSTVKGRVQEGKDALDVLRALFPGGSVTGAPKIRACEIVRELEPCARGPYTGAYGYFSVTGDARLAMGIRVIWCAQEEAAFGVGGGIVADSDIAEEYAETVAKAYALQAALGVQEGVPQATDR